MRVVELYATSKCNHKCKHCYINFESSWNPEDLTNTAISLGEQGYKVKVNGAEVLTNPNYLKAYKAVGQNFVFSNGIVLANDICGEVFTQLKYYDIETIHISHHFDSIDALNGVPCDIVEKAIYNAQINGFFTELHTTITSLNFDKVERMCDYAYEKKCLGIKYFPLAKVGVAQKLPSELFLSLDQKKYFYHLLLESRKKYPMEILDIRASGDFENVSNKFWCFFGQDHISITSDRMIYGCPFGVGNSSPIGFLNQDNVIVIENDFNFNRKKCYLHGFGVCIGECNYSSFPR